jgi:hypothetical protein
MTTINPYQGSSSVSAFSARLPAADLPIRDEPVRPKEPAQPPVNLRQRLDDLIGGEVATGRLSESQATDLRAVFDDAFARFGTGAPAPGGAAPSAQTESAGSSSSSAERSQDTTRTDSFPPQAAPPDARPANAIQRFLDALQASLDAGGASTYGASGRNNVAAIKTVPPLLINYRT